MSEFKRTTALNPALQQSRYFALRKLMIAGAMVGLGNLPDLLGKVPKKRRPYPTMVCSPREEIVAWNRAVELKKRAKLVAKLDRRSQGV
jgi:hypothetical protein